MAADRTSRSSARFRRDDSCCSTTSCTSHTVPTPALCRFVAKLAVASGVIAQGPLAGDLFHLLQVVPVMVPGLRSSRAAVRPDSAATILAALRQAAHLTRCLHQRCADSLSSKN